MSRQPDPYRSLRDELSRIKVTLRRMASASPFFGTGMHPNGSGGIDSDNFEAGVSGYSFKSDGNAEFNDLTLRGGIIGNDALTDPVVPQVINIRTTNFAVGIPFAEVLGQTVTVPSGCTRLQITQACWLQLLNAKTTGGNNGAGGDYIYVQPVVGGTVGDYTATGVSGSSGTATASSGMGQLFTGLTPGDTLRVSAYGATDYGITASTSNKCLLTATLNWLR